MKSLFPYAAVLAAMLAVPAAAQEAQQAIVPQSSDAGQRVNLAGKLRMLSQRIPAAACNQAGGIATGEAVALLEGAVEEFQAILNALEDGDPDLGIDRPEQGKRVLADLGALQAIWYPVRSDFDALAAGAVSDERVARIIETEPQLLDVARHLVAMVTAQHSDPNALDLSHALAIDVAGRQRMLAQRMSKSACMMVEGLEPERAAAELAGARSDYGASLAALRNGMPAAGIIEPPTDEIAAALDDVATIWARFEGLLDAVVAGEATPDQRAEIMRLANSLTAEMNRTVGLYTQFAQRNML